MKNYPKLAYHKQFKREDIGHISQIRNTWTNEIILSEKIFKKYEYSFFWKEGSRYALRTRKTIDKKTRNRKNDMHFLNIEKNQIYDLVEKKALTRWEDRILVSGILMRQSEYLIIQRNKKRAIFHIDDLENPITDWLPKIRPYGLVNNTSQFYLYEKAKEKDRVIFAVRHKKFKGEIKIEFNHDQAGFHEQALKALLSKKENIKKLERQLLIQAKKRIKRI